jgi:AraC-like DNA-binding protein
MPTNTPPINHSPIQTTIGSWPLAVAKALDSYQEDARELAQQFDIDLSQAHDPQYRVPADKVGAFYEAAYKKSEDCAFALTVAKHTSPTTFHALGFAALASDSLANVIPRIQEYAGVLSESARVQLECKKQKYWLNLQVPLERPKGSHLAIEAVMASMFYFVKYYQHVKKIQLSEVHLKSPCPSKQKQKEFQEFYNCSVVFASDFNGFVFPAAAIHYSLPLANEAVAKASMDVVEQYMQGVTTSDFLKEVQKQIVAQLMSDTSQEAVAHALCMSVRTLQRRLLELGLSYRQVLEEVKFQVVKPLLLDPQNSLDYVAQQIGFSEQSSFTRAFKRWSNMTPGQFRKQG